MSFTLEYQFNDYNDGICITGISGDDTNIVIPEVYDGYEVTAISFQEVNIDAAIHIPKTVYDIYIWCCNFKKITIDPNNNNYKAVDNVIYNKSGDYLWFYLLSKDDATFIVPNGVKYINAEAFWGNQYLRNVILPPSVEDVGMWAFEWCSALTNVILLGTTPPMLCNVNSFSSCNPTFLCYSSSLEAYKTATNWSEFADKFVADDMRIAFVLNANAQKQYFASKEEIKEKVDIKDIATINGQKITEGGNIEIQGGSGSAINIVRLL